jgi:hypothetical protein
MLKMENQSSQERVSMEAWKGEVIDNCNWRRDLQLEEEKMPRGTRWI